MTFAYWNSHPRLQWYNEIAHQGLLFADRKQMAWIKQLTYARAYGMARCPT